MKNKRSALKIIEEVNIFLYFLIAFIILFSGRQNFLNRFTDNWQFQNQNKKNEFLVKFTFEIFTKE